MNCPQCHQTLKEGAQFCTNCGLRTLSGRDSLSESVPTVESANKAASGSAPAGDPLMGRVLDGKYEIVGRLGEGGMGAVYRARRVHIGDVVALKVLHPKFLTDASAVERFRREARAAAQLNHPNVVTIHDYGETQGAEAFAYIVMELVSGASLRDLLKSEHRLVWRRAVDLMRDICAGVGAAHRRNIVHRDIKPDNIIVLAADDDRERETVKVVDFGIAKLRDMAPDHALTQTGVMVGTPYYMSPEQCRGESLDARADVYSLGALLYEMLAGSPPFTAPSVTGVIAKHLTEPPPRMASELNVPPALEQIIARALAKDPQGRQADAAILARELQAAVQAGTETQVTGKGTNPYGSQPVAPPASLVSSVEPPPHFTPPPQAPPPFHQTPVPVSPTPQSVQQPIYAPTGPPQFAQGTQAQAAQSTFAPPPPPRKSRAPLVIGLLVVGLFALLAVFGIGALLLSQNGDGKQTAANRSNLNTAANRNGARPTPANVAGNTSANTTAARDPMQRVEEMILNDRALTENDLAGIPPANLRFLRNTVYARHGRIFTATELQNYFRSRNWYAPDSDYDDDDLTDNDRANATLIAALESAGGARTADAGTARREVAAVLEGWAAATRAHDFDAHMSFYADTLDTYYRSRGASVEQVASDRQQAFTRYTSLNVNLSNMSINIDPSGTRATATFDKKWVFSGQGRSTGAVRQMTWLTKIEGRWLITGEKDLEVLEPDDDYQ